MDYDYKLVISDDKFERVFIYSELSDLCESLRLLKTVCGVARLAVKDETDGLQLMRNKSEYGEHLCYSKVDDDFLLYVL